MEHPFTDTPWRRILFAAGTLTVAGVQTLLLHGYTGATWPVATADSLLTSLLLAVLVYLSWFVVRYAGIRGVAFLTGIVSLSIWVAGCFAVREAIVQLTGCRYASTATVLPFRLCFALPFWTAVMLGYRLQELNEREMQESAAEERATLPDAVPPISADEYLDRISVRDSARIHLIPVEELLYIEACGDYVTLFTSGGQYVKEQTMKYFETHLPPGEFIRIHRSTLVNVTQLSRIELYGKENYRITLKNGTKLKVSLSGYRLLKKQLKL